MESKLRIMELRKRIEALPRSSNRKRIGMNDDLRRAIVEGYDECGLGVREYCEALSISKATFNLYRQKIRGSYRPKKKHMEGFRRIEVQDEEALGNQSIVIEGPQGLKVSGLNLGELSRLWRLLC